MSRMMLAAQALRGLKSAFEERWYGREVHCLPGAKCEYTEQMELSCAAHFRAPYEWYRPA